MKKSDTSESVDVESSSENRSLSLLGGMSLIVSTMVGTGLFVVGGQIVQIVGSVGMSLIIWTIGALIALCGGLTYTEWGLMIPESGMDTPYLDHVFPKPAHLASFMFCWIRVLMVHPGVTAILTLFTAENLLLTIGVEAYEWYSKSISIVVLMIVCACTALSNSIATRTTMFVTALKLLVVVFLIVMGLCGLAGMFSHVKVPSNFSNAFKGTTTDIGAYANALYKVLFCMDGWSFLSSSMGELHNPRRNVPIAFSGGIAIVSCLYILLDVAYFCVLPVERVLAEKDQFIANQFANTIFAKRVADPLISSMTMICAFGGVLSVTFGASRVAQECAKRNYLPFSKFLEQTSPRFNTPFNATLFNTFIALVMVIVPPGKSIFFLIDMCMYGVWIAYLTTTIGFLVLRRREPDRERLFKVPLVCPIIVILAGLTLSISIFFNPQADSRNAAGAGVGMILLGFVVWLATKYYPSRK